MQEVMFHTEWLIISAKKLKLLFHNLQVKKMLTRPHKVYWYNSAVSYKSEMFDEKSRAALFLLLLRSVVLKDGK